MKQSMMLTPSLITIFQYISKIFRFHIVLQIVTGIAMMQNNYTLRTTKLLGGYIGFTPSVCPSRVRPASRPICSAYSSGWIHFIFTHLIMQLQKVCRVSRFLQYFKFEYLAIFLKYVTLTSCFDSGSDVNH